MRLTQYITEDREVKVENMDELVKLIKKDCKNYLKLLKGRVPLFRGMDVIQDYAVGLKRQRKNRKPRLMPKRSLVFIDEYLDKRLLASRKESMIATTDESRMQSFGNKRCFVFPKGIFQFAMVRSSDMNFTSIKTGWTPNDIHRYIFEYYKSTDKYEREELRIKIYEILDSTIDGNSQKAFNEAYRQQYEMWFDCDEYYYVGVGSRFSGIYNRL